jgi:hypothetical protein
MTTKNDPSVFDEDYFLRGIESKKSLYERYRWLPDLTIPMAERIAEHLEMELSDTVHDFGCSRGYLVKAFRQLGFVAHGNDVSKWAVDNADDEVKPFIWHLPDPLKADWIIAKDVLEHLNIDQIESAMASFNVQAAKGVFIVVPLAEVNNTYVVPEYEMDVTHIIRWPLWRWVQQCHHVFDESWEISARYRIKGIKDNYAQFARGNGFITIKKIADKSSER